MPAYECIFTYYDGQQRRGRCWLRLYARDRATAAIVSEVPGNGGAMLPQAIEHVSSALVDRFGLNPHRLTLVGHFPPDSPAWRRGEYNAVAMRWVADHFAYPQWRNVSAQDVQGIVGERVTRGAPFWQPRDGWLRCEVGARQGAVHPAAEGAWEAVVQAREVGAQVERGFASQEAAQGWVLDVLACLAAEYDAGEGQRGK